MSKIKLVRLSTGEELVGYVEENSADSSITITDAFSVVSTGEGQMGFIPFMAYTTAHADGFTVGNRWVMFTLDPAPEVEAKIRQLVSGIVVPD